MRAPASLLRPLAAAGIIAALTLVPLGPAAAADTIPAPAADPTPTPSTPAAKPPPKVTVPKAAAPIASADLGVAVTGVKVSQGSQGKPFIVTVTNNSAKPNVAKSVVVDVQATSVDNPVQLLGPNAGSTTCKADELKVGHFVCTIGDLGPKQKRNLQFVYGPKPDAKPHNNAATITASVKSSTPDPNPKNNEATGRVDIVAGGIDLGTVIPDTNVTDIGGVATTVAEIRNTGSADAKDVTFSVRAPGKSKIKAVNLLGTDGRFSVPCKVTGPTGATCTVGELKGNFLAKAQIQLTVDANVNPGDVLTGGMGGVAGKLKAMQSLAKQQGSDTTVDSKVKQKQISSTAAAETSDDPSDNGDAYSIPISDKVKADLHVTLTKVTGKAKSNVTVNGKVSNHGPSAASGLYVDVTIPTDTGYAAIPSACKHRGDNPRVLRCTFNGGKLAANKSFTFQLKVQVHDTKPGTDGSAVVRGNVADPVAKNNSAAMVIGLATADNASNTNGGKLPNTGSNAALFAFGGAALLLLGGALVLSTRRRRVV